MIVPDEGVQFRDGWPTTRGASRSIGWTLTVPVGKNTLGRIFSVLGEMVDGMGTLTASARRGIHRDAPPYVSLDTTRAIFESGIKVVDGSTYLNPRLH